MRNELSVPVSFWCESCRKDSDLLAVKDSIRGDEYFSARCMCGAKVVRYITEKAKDPYFFRSQKQKTERMKLSRDLIQPGQTGFETYYKDQWKKIEDAKEKYEAKILAKQKEKDAFYKQFKYDINARQTVKKALEAEERLSNYG